MIQFIHTFYWFIIFKLQELGQFLFALLISPYTFIKFVFEKIEPNYESRDRHAFQIACRVFSSIIAFILIAPFIIGVPMMYYDVFPLIKSSRDIYILNVWTKGIAVVLILALVIFLLMWIITIASGIYSVLKVVGRFLGNNWIKAQERATRQ